MLYSVGKDSSVMVRLAQKAFHPGRIPFPLLHIDTTMKFPQMYEFRDAFCKEIGADLHVYTNQEAIDQGANPWDLGTVKCCSLLKTQALLQGLREGNYDAAFGGARREEERSRAKERIFSFRDDLGQWDPKNQRPELWNLYNCRINKGESIRVFPISNWTELDIWLYIHLEEIPVVPMYFAEEREMIVREGQLIPVGKNTRLKEGEAPETVWSRFRTLGCYPCTGAVRSTATTVPEIIQEMMVARHSERITRVIDHDMDGSMEEKKKEGYF
jgi:sulfate adenylyltransferase subunit 2